MKWSDKSTGIESYCELVIFGNMVKPLVGWFSCKIISGEKCGKLGGSFLRCPSEG